MDNNLASRLAEIIEYKTGGKRAPFAEALGWSKQYLNKLLNGDAIGLSVVTSVVDKYPDIDARWLLTGEGRMVGGGYIVQMLRAWLALEEFIPVMSEGERMQLAGGRITWEEDDVVRWKRATLKRREEIEERFARSIEKSVKPGKNCK